MSPKMQPVSVALERPPGTPRLATFKEALRYGRWGKDKLYELIAAEKVTAYKDGHTTLVDLDTVDAYQRALPRVVARPRPKRRRRGR
jgi:excisionase family DNA binding protein